MKKNERYSLSMQQRTPMCIQPTPSNNKVQACPFPFIGTEHFDNQVVHHHSFTQHPEEGSQEEVVEQEGHYLAGDLGRRMKRVYVHA